MQNCEQMPGMSVLDHGASVFSYFEDLYRHLKEGRALQHEWRLPDWVYDERIVSQLMPLKVIRQYLVFHDCGKPFCRTVDDQGRVHFPNHSSVSEKAWLDVGGNAKAARLMGMDMDIHLLKGDGVAEFARRPEAATLLLAGLCEVHSNAQMFGGIQSSGFKMKWKQIQRRGKAIVKAIES